MSKVGTINFAGKSGKTYFFNIYNFDAKFKPIGAVFFVTKRIKSRDGSVLYQKIYVGQTNDLSERFENHNKCQCFNTYKADHICIHVENSEVSRLEKETDLKEKYHPVCNY